MLNVCFNIVLSLLKHIGPTKFYLCSVNGFRATNLYFINMYRRMEKYSLKTRVRTVKYVCFDPWINSTKHVQFIYRIVYYYENRKQNTNL